jgi:hypothetical protein
MGSGAVDSSCSGAVNLAYDARWGPNRHFRRSGLCGGGGGCPDIVTWHAPRLHRGASSHFGIVDGSSAVRRARGQFSRTVNRRVALDERLSPYLRTLVGGCAPHGAAVSRGSSSSSSRSARVEGGASVGTCAVHQGCQKHGPYRVVITVRTRALPSRGLRSQSLAQRSASQPHLNQQRRGGGKQRSVSASCFILRLQWYRISVFSIMATATRARRCTQRGRATGGLESEE